MINQSLKFVWAYMLQEGKVTTGNWSYYGGDFEDTKEAERNWRNPNKLMDELRASVKVVGIDWEKTVAPESSQHDCFEGTFSDSSTAESLLGVMVLNDGTEYIVGVGNAEKRFASYLESLKNLMDDQQRVRDLLGE